MQDLIISGVAINDLMERKHMSTYYSDGALQDFYTQTKFQISNILKTPEDLSLQAGEILEIIEPISIIEEDNGQVIVRSNEYLELQKNEETIIFLKKNTFGDFAIMNSNLGRYSLSEYYSALKGDIYQDLHAHSNEEVKIKEEIIKKYSDVLKK